MGNGFSPLHKAVASNDIGDLCVSIQNHGSLIDQQEDEVTILMQQKCGCRVRGMASDHTLSLRSIMVKHVQNKLTALMMACGKGYAPMVRELLRRGAAVDLTDKVTEKYFFSSSVLGMEYRYVCLGPDQIIQ